MSQFNIDNQNVVSYVDTVKLVKFLLPLLFLRCPFRPVALYSSFAEILMLTASLDLDIAITTVFRHAGLFDGTFRFIAVFASFKDKSNCLAAWHPKQNETKLIFIIVKHMALWSFSKQDYSRCFYVIGVCWLSRPIFFIILTLDFQRIHMNGKNPYLVDSVDFAFT